MRFFKKIFNFYINASIHVALSVYSLLRITEFYFNLPYNENLNYFLFFGTITGYNFVKYVGVAKLHHKSLTNDLKIIQIFSFFCFLLMLFYAFRISTNTLLLCLPFGFLTLLYTIPFLSGFSKNLRQISYLKIIVVALVWAACTVLLPVFDALNEISTKTIFIIIQRFLIVIVLILPFDIRDVKYDAISLQTIPKKIGVKATKRLGLALLLFTLIIEFLYSSNNTTKNAFVIFFFLTIVFLMRSKISQPKYLSSFWVESLPIFWWLFILGINHF